MVEFPHADRSGEKAHPDIDQREDEGFGGAADISELAALGEEEPVEEHFEHEQREENPDLEREAAARGPSGRPCQPVPAAKIVPFGLHIAQVTAQAVEFVPALRGFRTEFADRGGRGLPDRREPALEVEAGQALLVEVQFVEEDAMRAVLLRLHALDDPAFDIIENGRIGRRLLRGTTFGADPSDPEIRRELGDVQRREYLQRRAIVVLLPLEAANQTSECGAYCQFLVPMAQSGVPLPPTNRKRP